ncbi:MAG TPA: molecular chaperone, partial [Deltaproteobacteria bacterium]|nr:molecular chaperone [Deltaproteobacteria bacterium]
TGRPSFGSLRRAMDSLLDNWTTRWDIEPFRIFEREEIFTPSLDLAEDDKEFRVSAELPGLEQKDIKINLSKQHLSIQGEKKEEKEEKKKNYYRRERSFGSFLREIDLPCEVDANHIRAAFKQGVLTVTLPKSPKAREESKTIPIGNE